MARTSGTKTREQMLQMGFNNMPSDQVREAKSLGGKVSQARRRRKKILLEIASDILDLRPRNVEAIKTALCDGGLDDQDITYAACVVFVQILKALGGDTRAAEFVRDTSGQKPVGEIAVGNWDSRTIESLDMSSLSNDQLKKLMPEKSEVSSMT